MGQYRLDEHTVERMRKFAKSRDMEVSDKQGGSWWAWRFQDAIECMLEELGF